MPDISEATFLKDVSNHILEVKRDDGVYRHIVLRNPSTSNLRFELLTWPGSLCITGDMGTFVFERLEDMFTFFRTDSKSQYLARNGLTLGINRGYWGEKIQAADKNGGYKEFSKEVFDAAVKQEFDGWVDSYEPTNEEKEAVWSELLRDVLCHQDNGFEAMRSAMEFRPSLQGCRFSMRDFWEHSIEDYTYGYTWCCYAIAWGIQKYDAYKAPQPEAATAPIAA